MIILGFYFDSLPIYAHFQSIGRMAWKCILSKAPLCSLCTKNYEAKKLVLSQKYSFTWQLLFIRCLWLFCNLVIMMPWVRHLDVHVGSPSMGLKLGQSVAYFHLSCSAPVPENTSSFYILQRVSSGFSVKICLFLLLICKETKWCPSMLYDN